jgi:nuclease S1
MTAFRESRFRWLYNSAAALSILVLPLLIPNAGWAWGSKGHRVVARLAESKLTDKAREAIAKILDQDEDMADASTYPDEHKQEIKGSAPWHYVNVPITEDKYDEKFCGSKGCVVAKIKEFEGVLKDPNAAPEERLMALRFVIHLVGDVHQPLHVGDNGDRGGNQVQVRFFNKGSNLHKVWDTDMIEHTSHDEDEWLNMVKELDTTQNQQKYKSGEPEDWATESLGFAKNAYKVPGTNRQIESGEKLGADYADANLPVVRLRLYQGGIRLAMVLNDIFKQDVSDH